MGKYIDADILLDDLLEGRCESDILQKVRQAIVDEIIGIDGIDIVRCRECCWWDAEIDCGMGNRRRCCVMDRTMNPDNFCSYGERSSE